MSNQEQHDGDDAENIAFWLPIGVGMGAAIGGGLGAAASPAYLGIFIGLGTAVGLVLAGASALIRRNRP